MGGGRGKKGLCRHHGIIWFAMVRDGFEKPAEPQCMLGKEKVPRACEDPQSDLREPNLPSEINYFKDTTIIIQRKIKSRIHLPKNLQTLCHNKHVEDWGWQTHQIGPAVRALEVDDAAEDLDGEGPRLVRHEEHLPRTPPLRFPKRGPTCWKHFVPLQIYLHGYGPA